MSTTPYTLSTTVAGDLDAVDPKVRAALADQGFGVLTEIDVEATLRAKVGAEIGGYRILGACNPQLAHRGLQADPELGALLPCNVVLRAGADGQTEVLAIDPHTMMGVSDTPELAEVAEEARIRLQQALAALEA